MTKDKITLETVHSKLAEIEQKLDQLSTGERRESVANGQEWLPIHQAAAICG